METTTQETEFHWRGWGDGTGNWDSWCALRIRQTSTRDLVLVTDLGLDTGTSITNAAEHVATLVVHQYGLRPTRLVWIEHFPRSLTGKATWDLVTFDWDGQRFSRPAWRPLTDGERLALLDDA